MIATGGPRVPSLLGDLRDRVLTPPGLALLAFLLALPALNAGLEDGRPLEVAFRFRKNLEDNSYRWLYMKKFSIKAFPLPVVGQSVTLAGIMD